MIDQAWVLPSTFLQNKTLQRTIYKAKNLAACAALLLCVGNTVAWSQAAPAAAPTATPQASDDEKAERKAQRAAELARQKEERAMQRAERMKEMAERMRTRDFDRVRRSMSGLHAGPPGKWWSNPEMAEKLGLTKDQQKKMDDIFLQSRLKLIDANASLQKEEAILEPLVQADQPDEPKILAQIDRVAQARAELEKTNARMLLGLRQVLTPDQWEKLRAEAPRADNFEALVPGPMGVHIQPPVPPIRAVRPLE